VVNAFEGFHRDRDTMAQKAASNRQFEAGPGQVGAEEVQVGDWK
jgi:hypothetical protein